ncbi:MAG: bifunctional 5,10-methylenetetrahydrofolate dehydrogenase/5,10-methenyltetrahydrofolate cyclohydrolase [Bacilli bacterium]
MVLLKGSIIFDESILVIKKEVDSCLIKPCLAVIQVGNDGASDVYVNRKRLACVKTGIVFKHFKYDCAVLETEVINKIKELNSDKYVDGILVQLPLASHLNVTKIINYIDYAKDVDGLTDISLGRLVHNKDTNVPCTPMGIIKMLDYYDISVVGKNVVIVGCSSLIGLPLMNLLINRGATVSMCHIMTNDLKSYTCRSDILIVATGHKHLITADMVCTDSVVIDVGITRENGNLYGDVDFEAVKDKVYAITPVPGGVGPMTVLMLLLNVMKSYKNK